MSDDIIFFNDEYFMRLALRQAENAAADGETPVGCVAVKDGTVIARACNQVEKLKDATAHAEILALTQAAAAVGDWRLDGVTLYVTKEPCAMCAGAMVNSRVKKVVFGVADPRSGAAGSALDVTGFPGMLHNVEVNSGVLKDECLALLKEFFRQARNRGRN
jgi:tRNA(adenine34) deaminase